MQKTILILTNPLVAPTPEQLRTIADTAPGYRVLTAESVESALEKDPEALRNTELVLGSCPDELLENAPNLRWVQQFFAGANWIYRSPELIPTLKERKITVTKASGVHAACIAQHAMGFILNFARQIHKAVQNRDGRDWNGIRKRTRLEDMFELEGLTAVLVGVGAIGSRFATYASAFGMRIIGVRRNPSKSDPNVERMVSAKELPEVLPDADLLVLIAPGTPETKSMIGKKEFEALKPGAVLVNLGRGSVVDEKAMIQALRSGRLAGAGLDVTEEEPLPADSPLWSMDNVIITPHSSGRTPRYMDHLFPIFHENLDRYMAGKPLTNTVDLDAGY